MLAGSGSRPLTVISRRGATGRLNLNLSGAVAQFERVLMLTVSFRERHS